MISRRFFVVQTLGTLLFLVTVVLLCETTGLDMAVQDAFYQFDSQQWLLSKHDAVLRLLFYSGPKTVFILFAVTLLISLVALRNRPRVKRYRRGLLTVLIASLLTVGVVNLLKGVTNVPCPVNLMHYDGNYPYVTLLHRVAAAEHLKRIRCFPAGHASGGFALLSLFFLFRTKRNRMIAFNGAMALGWTLGLYKMLIGDHFLSHTLVTMGLAWLISVVVAGCVFGLARVEAPAAEVESDSLVGAKVN
ncbi:phosphatase PAP2 family protein [Marinobacter halodurans]|uniref:Phosphatase PAP2 family protein n=1 Tax=Marinobacter halodurans TaxID=2528979 RepID=A0ABY1ZJ15_9GAMM|nr:phosphatase PAP2 family protein [Marinobacter halodurans]TBW49379.1 phosphatase PAP2 family protein [Marinobacter halodurans]